MKVNRKIIKIDEELCNGCGNCVVACAEGAIKIIDGKAKVIKDQYCDGLGACIGECPQNALEIIEREAEEFDEKAVEEYLAKLEKEKSASSENNGRPATLACGCPSTHIQTFRPFEKMGHEAESKSPCSCSDSGSLPGMEKRVSALGHWPVQIRLVPATAPFLKGADLLVTADCVPVAYPAFHQDFLKGKVVMMGCPKFGDVEAYVQKFADIFRTAGIKSVTVLIMEVPCCSALPGILNKAMAVAGVEVPVKKVVISARGEVLS